MEKKLEIYEKNGDKNNNSKDNRPKKEILN